MELTVERDRTLIVHGPAALTLIEGRGRCLGADLAIGTNLTVRRLKALPIYCTVRSRFDVKLGAGASLEEGEGDTIPDDWKAAARTIIEATKSGEGLTVAILGAVDVGKSTFTTFLANTALQVHLRVRIVDADLGQSDIGPPTTIGEHSMEREVYDLFRVIPDRLTFVGATSPAHAAGKMLAALSELSKSDKAEGGLNIFNTDGWVEGEEAIQYKLSLLRAIDPNLIVAAKYVDELDALLEKIQRPDYGLIAIKTPSVVRRRNREERRELREQAYLKYLQDSTLKIIPYRQLKVRGQPLWRRGTLLGLYGEEGQLLGIGTLGEYDPERDLVKIMTPIKGRIAELEFGQVIIEDGREAPAETQPPSGMLRNGFKSAAPV